MKARETKLEDLNESRKVEANSNEVLKRLKDRIVLKVREINVEDLNESRKVEPSSNEVLKSL